jgi:hypothetical protein
MTPTCPPAAPQAFIDRFRFNANRAALVQSRIKALERMADVQVRPLAPLGLLARAASGLVQQQLSSCWARPCHPRAWPAARPQLLHTTTRRAPTQPACRRAPPSP